MSLGTPAYMSPEQAMGEREIGARSDVYALGAMTYEMLAGEPPFTGPSSQAIVAKVLTEQPPPLRPKRPTVPPAAEAAIMTALQKLPADRWGSAREFSDALTGAGTRSGSVPDRPDGGRAAARRHAPRDGCSGPAGSLAGVAAAVAAWALSRPRPELPPSRLAILVPGLGGSGASSQQRHLAFLPGRADAGVRHRRHGRVAPAGAARARCGGGNADPERASAWAVRSCRPTGAGFSGRRPSQRQVLRLPLDGGTQELVVLVRWPRATRRSPPTARSGTAATPTWAPSSVIRSCPGCTKGGYHLLQILDDGRSALTVRTRVGNAAGPIVLVDLKTGAETQILTPRSSRRG